MGTPQSRNEAILQATIDGTEYTDPPQSRIEDLLIQLKAAIEEGGGGTAGVTSFNGRNGAVLPASGDYTAADVGVEPLTSAQITALEGLI